MKKHRSIIITSFVISLLLLCFTPQSEGRTFPHSDRILGEASCNEGYADYQLQLINSLYYNVKIKEAGEYTPFCSGSGQIFFHAETSFVLEKRYGFSKWHQYIDKSQRLPPFLKINYSFNLNR